MLACSLLSALFWDKKTGELVQSRRGAGQIALGHYRFGLDSGSASYVSGD